MFCDREHENVTHVSNVVIEKCLYTGEHVMCVTTDDASCDCAMTLIDTLAGNKNVFRIKAVNILSCSRHLTG